MKKININLINTEKIRGWQYVVNTSSSLMSLSWIEHFFLTKEEAREFVKLAYKQGFVALMCTKEEY